MYKRILLPLDGSPVAEQALPYAVAQAECFRAEVIVLRVLEPLAETRNLPQSAVSEAKQLTSKIARDYLEQVATRIREERDIPVQVVIIEGRPHAEIIRFAEANQVDLLVICTRGHSGLTQWLIGSTCDRVVRGTNIPVLLIPASAKGE